jgi:hypothetical protein
MTNTMAKLILWLVFPFVYLLHPRLRKYHALRLKYWAKDKDFFKQEVGIILVSVTVALIVYTAIFGGIAHTLSTGIKVGHIIREGNEAIIREAQLSIAKAPELRSTFDTNVVIAEEAVQITKAEYEAVTETTDLKALAQEKQGEAERLLEKAKRKKRERLAVQ